MLELILAVIILAVMGGILVPMVSGAWAEQAFRNEADQLRGLAREARLNAVSQRETWTIQFYENGFSLFPENGVQQSGEAIEEEPQYKLSEGTAMELLRWDGKDWKEPQGEEWIFRPSGVCEPLRVRFIMEGGGWIEYGFHPLTADVQDEKYSFP